MKEHVTQLLDFLGFGNAYHPGEGGWAAHERESRHALGNVNFVQEPHYFDYKGQREGPIYLPAPPGGKRPQAERRTGFHSVNTSGWNINTPEQEAKYNYYKTKDINRDHDHMKQIESALSKMPKPSSGEFMPTSTQIEGMGRYWTRASAEDHTIPPGDLVPRFKDEWPVHGFKSRPGDTIETDWQWRVAKRDNARYGKRPVIQALIEDHQLVNKSLGEIEAEMREENRNRIDPHVRTDTRPSHACRPA